MTAMTKAGPHQAAPAGGDVPVMRAHLGSAPRGVSFQGVGRLVASEMLRGSRAAPGGPDCPLTRGEFEATVTAMQAEREFDLVIYGATGFTGGLVADYFAQRASRSSLRVALAGRNAEKLSALRERLRTSHPAAADFAVVTASTGEPESLDSMASRTRLVLSTAGPFVEHGPPVVAACVEHGTHWLDNTGEPKFVHGLLKEHHARAVEKNCMVVSCCGFDSIPHDLGAFFAVRELDAEGPVQVDGFIQFEGKVSGGTWNSALGAIGDVRGSLAKHPRAEAGEGRRVRLGAGKLHRDAEFGWVAPMPTIDPEIVLRSAASLPEYGPDFEYRHFVRLGKMGTVVKLGAGVAGVALLAQAGWSRRLLGKLIPPGEGPSAEVRAASTFEVRMRARSEDRSVNVAVRGGDPGYDETAKMISEAALSILEDGDRLPGKSGVLTPVEAMGEVLLARLQAAGIEFVRLDS